MAGWICRNCGTVTAVGIEGCPHCGVFGLETFYEQGDDTMAKISVHGGPSDQFAEVPEDDNQGATEGQPEHGEDLEPMPSSTLGVSTPAAGLGGLSAHAVGTVTPATERVPEDATTREQVLAWVDDEPDQVGNRARAALAAENEREGGPRTTLVAELERRLSAEQARSEQEG